MQGVLPFEKACQFTSNFIHLTGAAQRTSSTVVQKCRQRKEETVRFLTVLVEKYDLFVIMDPWWDESHGWSAANNGYKLFRRDRQGKKGGDCPLNLKRKVNKGLTTQRCL